MKDLSKLIESLQTILTGIDWDESFYHKRLPEWETYDAIVMGIVPRWKESGLSGDEWRYGVNISFMFKGLTIKTEYARDMNAAVMLLGWYKIAGKDEFKGIPDEILAKEKIACDNIGCPADATQWFALRRQTSDRGEWLEREENFVYYRQFCDAHAHRGDCSREDNDENYVAITKIK